MVVITGVRLLTLIILDPAGQNLIIIKNFFCWILQLLMLKSVDFTKSTTSWPPRWPHWFLQQWPLDLDMQDQLPWWPHHPLHYLIDYCVWCFNVWSILKILLFSTFSVDHSIQHAKHQELNQTVSDSNSLNLSQRRPGGESLSHVIESNTALSVALIRYLAEFQCSPSPPEHI